MKKEENSPVNTLFIEGGSHANIKKALRQWIDSYASQLQPDFVFKLYKNGHGKHVVQADEQLDNTLFYFLVNYMAYPVGIDYKVEIEGFTIGTEMAKLQGRELLVFISEFDTEYDHVLIVTENNNCYKMELNGRFTESPNARSYRKRSFTETEEPDVLKVKGTGKKTKDNSEIEKRIERRLNIGLYLFIGCHAFNFFLIRPFSLDKDFSFGNVSLFLFFSLSVWLYIDYKILRSEKRYLKSFGLSLIFLLYVYFLYEQDIFQFDKFTLAAAISTPLLLLIQWPVRLLFILLVKREPEVERRTNFADMLYSFILFFGMLLGALLIVS